MLSKQNQKGGDGSTNIQTEQMIVQVGIDEKRAREIYQEMNLQLKNDYTEEAFKVANERVTEFENKLMPKMENVDGALEAFADPSFQILLVEAQKTAASSERPADYDLLSELLIHRFQKGDNRIVRAGISRAVEVVDEISDEALLGLTAFHAVNTFFPVTGEIYQGLDVLDALFGKIFYGKLPTGNDWLDHLDILDAVRLSSFGSLKNIEQYYPEQLSGYVDTGIEKKSDNFEKAIEILDGNNLPRNILVQHALNPDFVRLPVSAKQQIDSLNLIQQIPFGEQFIQRPVELVANQKEALHTIYGLYDSNVNVKNENTRLFMEAWDKKTNLNALKSWWNNLQVSIQITSVGKVLAHANAQRCDKNLPPLN
ncbi:LPO_1073/Vpar_1526 family protein [Vibrio sp. 10N.261.52.C11]|uniref:LPO_1073/Vpar_1526 family protein n=1 Tax=Vibrio sp. 10N.261.52.C11 TaxID=3229680 RepID=UPI003551F3C5